MTDTPLDSIRPSPAGPAPPLLPRPRFIAGIVFGAPLAPGPLWFKIFEPIQVLPRIRLAPGFALIDQRGAQVTSEDLRGSVVLYTFTYAGCPEPCPAPEPTMAEIQSRIAEVDLGETEVRFVTLSFDATDTPAALTARAEEMGADGTGWFYATAEENRLKPIIGSGFKTYYEAKDDGSFAFDPALILVDGWGVIRGEYRYQTLASDPDRILNHIDILAEEVRNAHGPAGLAYEAAHFFLCYP